MPLSILSLLASGETILIDAMHRAGVTASYFVVWVAFPSSALWWYLKNILGAETVTYLNWLYNCIYEVNIIERPDCLWNGNISPFERVPWIHEMKVYCSEYLRLVQNILFDIEYL